MSDKIDAFKNALFDDFRVRVQELAKEKGVEKERMLAPAVVSVCVTLLSGSIAAIKQAGMPDDVLREGLDVAISDLRQTFEEHLGMMNAHFSAIG